MGTTYTRPDVYAEEVPQLESPVSGAATGFGAIMGITEKGPIGSIQRTRSFAAWQKIYGGRETRSDAAYEAKLFFDEGGVELLTNRICHFSDIDDKTSYTGGLASSTAITDGVAATSATKDSSVGPFVLEAGGNFDLDVDDTGDATVTFDATAATRAGSGLSISDLSGDTFIVSFDGGEAQTVTFTSESTAAEAAAKINEDIYGGRAVVNAGEIDIESDTQGTDSSVTIGAGTANTELGHSEGSASGTGDVGNIKAVTAAELETVIEADTTALVTVNGDGSITVDSPTTGTSSELEFKAGSPDILAALGFSVEVIVGTAAGATYNTLRFQAGYQGYASPGADGNNIRRQITQNPLHASLGAGNDLSVDASASDTTLQVASIANIAAGSVIKIWDGTNTEYHEVEAVRSTVASGVVSFYLDLVGSGLTNAFTAALSQIQTQEFDVDIYDGTTLVEQWAALSMLDTADNYVETLINDENTGSQYVLVTDMDAAAGMGADIPATDSAIVALTGGSDETVGLVDADWIGTSLGGTGFYAFEGVRDFMPICTPNKNTAAVVHAGGQYCESRMWMEYIAYVTVGSTKTQAVAYRNNTLGLDSKYVSLYAGGAKLFDPAGSGSSPRRLVSGVGAIMGLRSRVDGLPEPTGGPWQTPAGEGDYGKIKSALDVATEYNDTESGEMNAAHINVIRKFSNTSPVLVWGGRTLYTNPNKRWRYINVTRFFMYVEKSIVDSTRWAVFRNNDFKLWSSIKNKCDAWLYSLLKDGAFPSTNKLYAYFVKCGFTDGTMDQSNVDNGEVIIEIGLAPNKPGEFIIFRFSQYDSGYLLEEV